MAQAVRKAFAVGADTHDRAHRKLVPCFDDFYRAALELLPFKPDDRFETLDLGAGTGLLFAMIAKVFPKARLTSASSSLTRWMSGGAGKTAAPGKEEAARRNHAGGKKALVGSYEETLGGAQEETLLAGGDLEADRGRSPRSGLRLVRFV